MWQSPEIGGDCRTPLALHTFGDAPFAMTESSVTARRRSRRGSLPANEEIASLRCEFLRCRSGQAQ
jgi:hypothetical protein